MLYEMKGAHMEELKVIMIVDFWSIKPSMYQGFLCYWYLSNHYIKLPNEKISDGCVFGLV